MNGNDEPGRRSRLLRERAQLAGRMAEIDAELVGDVEPPGSSLGPEERERRFRRMLDGGWDVITLVDESLRYTYVSGSVELVTGYTPEEFLASGPKDRVHPDDLPRFIDLHRALMAVPGSVTTCAYRFRHKSGEWVWVETVSTNLFHDPALRGILATSRDISARRRAEQALAAERAELEHHVAERTEQLARTNAALERAARTKDEFLAAMSHELRTPLNGVLGLAEAIDEGTYGPVAAPLRRPLALIRDSGRHLLSLIEDILDLSKLEADKVELAMERLQVADICRSCLSMVQQASHKKRQRLDLWVDDEFAQVDGDPRRLRQIVVNLLANAVKFTPEGGVITLHAGPEGLDRVRFTVTDTGIGIAPADLPRLFQPFVQLDASLARRHAGTGLGLALVRKLTEAHGGTVEVESRPGVGSRFSVFLPARHDGATLAPPPAPPPSNVRAASRPPEPAAGGGPPGASPGRRRRLLVAEDDDTNLAALVEFLESRGFDLDVAHDGAEALQRARAAPPDLIIMDIQMPCLDGLSATRALRAEPDPALRDVPIIALTAMAMAGDRETCLAAGASAYVAKPVGLRRLDTLIGELLAGGLPRAS